MLLDLFKKNKIDLYLIIAAVLPIWFFENRNFLDSFVLIFFTLLIFFLISITFFLKKKNLNLSFLFLSIIIFYGLDSKIGFLSLFKRFLINFNQFINYIFPTIFLFLSIYLIFFFLKNYKRSKQTLLASILAIFLFSTPSIFFKMSNYEFENIKLNDEDKKKENIDKVIIIQLDEHLNLAFMDDTIPFSKEAKKSSIELYKKYNFKLYSSAYSIYDSTQFALPALLNFEYNTEKNNLYGYASYTFEDVESLWKLNKNNFFEQNKEKKIITTKSLINFCDDVNVKKCIYSNYLNNYKKYPGSLKFSSFDYIIRKTHEQKSLLFQYIWRAGKKLGFFDYYHYSLFSKLSFENQLENTSFLINNSNYELYYLYYFFPHNPWALELNSKENKCEYNDNLYRQHWWDKDEKLIEQHYKEIVCTNFYLDKFLGSLEKNKNFDNFKILILSDHGLPIYQHDENKLTNYNQKTIKNRHGVLFAIKDNKAKNTQIDNQLISSQELFSKYFNKEHRDTGSSREKKIYNMRKDKFVRIGR